MEIGINLISTCKKTKTSTWAGNNVPRNTREGMGMFVEITRGKNGKKESRTFYK